MKYLLLSLFFLIGIFLETYIVKMPFVTGILIIVTVLFPQWTIFLLACIVGIILDSVNFHSIGTSSIFFSVLIALLLLYSRKYEMQNPVFVGVSIFVGSLLYGALFIHRYSFWSALICCIVLTAIYIGILFFILPKKKDIFSF